MKRTLIGLLMLCCLLICASAFASPKDDFKQIWENYTIESGRYEVYLDTKFALFGKVQNKSIMDITTDPLFIRSEDSMTMFGKTRTTINYAVQDGETINVYMEDETADSTKKQWIHTTYSLPPLAEEDDLPMPAFDNIVRSVEFIEDNKDKGQLYAVKLDGRSAYKQLKKYHKNMLASPSEENTDADTDTNKVKKEKMHALLSELLKTWKDTENIIILARVKEGKIKAVQTELAPQFNAMTHVIASAVDTYQKETEHDIKIGGLLEAFLQAESMRLTIIADGKAQHTQVPQEILETAVEEAALQKAEQTAAGENKPEPTR